MDIDTYREWNNYQMSSEMNWSKNKFDKVKPIPSFDVSNDEELLEASNWVNTQPLLKEFHHQKGRKFDLFFCLINLLHYRLQSIKAYQFNELNEQEG